jgi:DNA-binding NtrC family response regulator
MDTLHTVPLNTDSGIGGEVPLAFVIRVGRSHEPHRPEPLIIQLTQLGELEVGRGEEDRLTQDRMAAKLQLADPSLSGRHARFVRLLGPDGPHYAVEDMGSTNGCFVNGQRTTGPRPLADGDIVETGQTFWRFWLRPLEQVELLLERAYQGGPVSYASTVSFEMLGALSRLEHIAPSDLSVIIHGESGTGKEGMARELHERSGRAGPLVALNCAAIPEGLIESELFGHSRGAFTGAVTDKQGLIEAAEGGTLLLDEVGDMPLPAQAKLLRVLQERSYVRLGETRSHSVDVRFIASTHHDLRTMVEGQQFRGDLYARLNGLSLTLPALRERREDLGLLIATFLGRETAAGGKPLSLTHEAYRALVLYDWPFNIRELEKAISVAVAFAEGAPQLKRFHLPEQVSEGPSLDRPRGAAAQGPAVPSEPAGDGDSSHGGGPLDYTLQARLLAALREHRGNITLVAQALETSRMQVYRWLKRLKLDPKSFRQTTS